MGVEGAGAGAPRSYRVRVSRENPFYVDDGWDYPISQSNRHLLLHPNQVMVENPYYARMMAEVQAEESYFRQLRAAAPGRSLYEETASRVYAPPMSVVADEVILENMLLESARAASTHQFGAVGQSIPNANRPRAVDVEAASVSSEEDDEDVDDENEEVEEMDVDQELLDAIASVKTEMMAKNEELKKTLEKKMNESTPAPAVEVTVDDTIEEIPSTFRWVHIEIV